MKRVMLIVAAAAVFFAWSGAHALATAEFCPARLAMRPIDGGAATGSRIFGFNLSAQGPRTVTAMLAFDTDAGWFTAAVPPVAIAEKDRRYTSPWADFMRRDFVSEKMYLQFPAAVKVRRAWVYAAQAANDDFGWTAQGQVKCSASAAIAVPLNVTEQPPTLDPRDSDHLNDPPPANAKPIVPVKSATLGQTNCGQPFVDAMVTTPASPDYPSVLSVHAPTGAAGGTAIIQVAINADGTLSDAWIWGTSGFSALDNAALGAAKRSGYRGAIAYCEPVPAMYFFKVTFDPNG